MIPSKETSAVAGCAVWNLRSPAPSSHMSPAEVCIIGVAQVRAESGSATAKASGSGLAMVRGARTARKEARRMDARRMVTA